MPGWAAAIPAAISLLSASQQSDAAEDAANTQAGASRAGVEEQRAARLEMRKLLEPYVAAGPPALTQQQNIIGLAGPEAQQAAIQGFSSSPFFQSVARQGEDAILQNATATGGLRGGNTQAALAQFRPQLLNQLIDQQYARLGGLTTLGQNSAVGVGTSGIQSATNISNLLGNQGAAVAGGQLAAGQAYGNLAGTISKGFGTYQDLNPPGTVAPTSPTGTGVNGVPYYSPNIDYSVLGSGNASGAF